MQEVLKRIGPVLRALGFRGSGQNYRKTDRDFVLVVNFQGSRWGDNFYVNLGAQPVFIPAQGGASLEKLKEYECMLRRRVGKEWPWLMSDEAFAKLESEITSTQSAFFGHAQTLREALAVQPPEELVRRFSWGTTEARATLHLARAAARLGHLATARELVTRGLDLAGERGTVLRSELHEVLEKVRDGGAEEDSGGSGHRH